MASILLVEDDPTIRLSVEMALSDEGYSVMTCDDGNAGLASALALRPDLILLDLLLPGLDGREFIVEFRKKELAIPIIVLTALSGDEDKITCLDSGADDYVCKPFSIDELLARIRVCLRKSATAPVQAAPNKLEFGDMVINLDDEVVTVKGEPVYLKRKEYALLLALAQEDGALLKRKWLIDKVWGKSVSPTTNTIDAHIYSLRKALDKVSDYEFIATEYGRGYRFQPKLKES